MRNNQGHNHIHVDNSADIHSNNAGHAKDHPISNADFTNTYHSVENILAELNDAQASVVHETDRPIIVIAGAGAGKTKTIVAKIKYYIAHNIATASKIIAVTFTNKAAGELRHRLFDVNYGIRIGTFHRISMEIISDIQKQFADLPEYIQNLKPSLILSGDEQLAIVRQVLSKRNIKGSPYSYMQNIQAVKECGRVMASTEERAIFDAYEVELLKVQMFDFSDILLKLVQLWELNPQILAACRQNVQMLCVDEYQDINDLQFKWIKLLYHPEMHLCCVGDPDQSIYGFRGANINHILNFDKTFHNARMIKLEKNYRSKKDILDKSNALIKNNKHRIDKALCAHNDSNDRAVHLHNYLSDLDEADGIARFVIRENLPGTVAILIREKQQSQRIEAALIKHQIAYSVVGVYNFMDRAEVKDLLAYLKFANNPRDAVSFRRAIMSPRRGIGDVTIRNIIQSASDHDVGIDIAAKDHSKTGEFLKLIAYIRDSGASVDKILEHVYSVSGYSATIDKSKDSILREWFTGLSEFKSVNEYLSTLLWQEAAQDQTSSVNLMTIHASKGLEFDYVFLPGWEEGIVPHKLSKDPMEIEEERRLAYVAMTRARHAVFISHARQRMLYGYLQQSQLSRFIKEAFYAPVPAQSSARPRTRQIVFNVDDIVRHGVLGMGMVLECGEEYAKVQFMDKAAVVAVDEIVRA